MTPHTLALIAKAKAAHAARLEEQASQASKQLASNSAQATMPAAHATNQLSAADVPLVLSSIKQEDAAQASISSGAMTFNPEQLAAIELGLQGKSFCLIGAAGTGKTTVTQELISRVQRASHMRPLAFDTKQLSREAPGIVICGFTNKAVNNIRKKLPSHLQSHCMTIHKLLEYQPNYYEVADDEGMMKTTMRFEPSRNAANPLPHISTIIFEESSMIGTELYAEVIAALPKPQQTQIIFLGDLNQIPPVFGPSILGFKLAELPIIELTHVYRQALQSPIISLATDVRTNSLGTLADWLPGNLGTEATKQDAGEHGVVTIKPWKKRVSKENALAMMKVFLPRIIESGEYDPEADMILCPFNKSFGTVELNNIISDYLGKQRQAEVFEVIARHKRTYWAVGDRVLVDRHEAVITKIEKTIGYLGKEPVPASTTLDRWGYDPANPQAPRHQTAEEVLNALDNLAGADEEEAKNLASHTITVEIPDLGETRTLNTAGDINNMLFGYCLTVHKSQGSEWQRVFIFLHNSHATMISRELIYTAITRAKHELYMIVEADIAPYENSLKRAASRPVIPGTTLAEKIDFFKGKKASMTSMGDEG